MNGILILCAVVVALAFFFVLVTLHHLRRDVDRLSDRICELGGEWTDEKWDVRAALRALGLRKTEAKPSEWVKDGK
jgi:hypothetical protein